MKYLVLFVLLVSPLAFAEDDTSSISREPALHVGEKAQARQYPGGRDEQDIKVQSSLAQPTRNIDGSPVGEMAVPDDHD